MSAKTGGLKPLLPPYTAAYVPQVKLTIIQLVLITFYRYRLVFELASWPPNHLIKTGVRLITIIYRLYCSLNLISNNGQSTVELIGQCSDLVRKWPMADHYIVLCMVWVYVCVREILTRGHSRDTVCNNMVQSYTYS